MPRPSFGFGRAYETLALALAAGGAGPERRPGTSCSVPSSARRIEPDRHSGPGGNLGSAAQTPASSEAITRVASRAERPGLRKPMPGALPAVELIECTIAVTRRKDVPIIIWVLWKNCGSLTRADAWQLADEPRICVVLKSLAMPECLARRPRAGTRICRLQICRRSQKYRAAVARATVVAAVRRDNGLTGGLFGRIGPGHWRYTQLLRRNHSP